MDRETAEAWGLGAIGAVQGAWKYYVRPELTAERAWAGLIGAITLYELVCPPNQTLSEGVDRAISKHPVAVPLAIGYTAAHLCNILPEQIDLFHKATEIIKR